MAEVNPKIIANTLKVGKKIAMGVAVNAATHSANKAIDNVVFKTKKSIRIPNSAEEYFHRDVKEVKEELEAYGFTNINLVERKDLHLGIMIHEGAIEQISIAGNPDFKKKAKFPLDANVVIIYHTFIHKNV